MEKHLVRNQHNQTIKADRRVIQEIKKIAFEEERTIQTITNRILKVGLQEYPKRKQNNNGI